MQDEDAKDETKTREGDKPRICKTAEVEVARWWKKQRGRGVKCVVGIKVGYKLMRWMIFFQPPERLSLDFREFSNIPQTQNQQFMKEFLSFGGLGRPGVCSRGYVGVLLGWNLSGFHQSHMGIRKVPPFHQCHARWEGLIKGLLTTTVP